MKLLLKQKVARAEKPAPAKPASKGGPVITTTEFDNRVMYVGRRIRVANIRSKTLGLSIPKLTQVGYLVVKGDKPGLLVHEVKWDGQDLYSRKVEKGALLFGSLAALNSTKHKGYEAKILDKSALVDLAVKTNQVRRVTHCESGKHHTVALLNKWEESYVCGLEVHGTGITPMNMEHKGPWNDHVPHVRYADPANVDKSAKEFLPH